MGISRGLLKLLLVGFCAMFLVAGIAIAAVSIWTIVDKVFLSYIIGTNNFTMAAYFLLIGGIIVISASIFGLVAISKQRKLLVLIFFILFVVIFLLLLIGAIIAVVFRGQLEDKMILSMKETLVASYGKSGSANDDVTWAWDKVQKDLQCCAVEGKDWRLYRQTAFYEKQEYVQSKKYVPETCCKYDERLNDYTDVSTCQHFPLGPPNNPTTMFTNNFLNYDGCYIKAKEFLLSHSSLIVALGFVFSFALIAGLVFAFLYYLRISRDEAMERKHGYTERDAARDQEENRRL